MRDRALSVYEVINGGLLMSLPLLILSWDGLRSLAILFLASFLLFECSARKRSLLLYLAVSALFLALGFLAGGNTLSRAGLMAGVLIGAFGFAIGRWKGNPGCFQGTSPLFLIVSPFWYAGGMILKQDWMKPRACLFAAVYALLCLLCGNRRSVLKFLRENGTLNRFPKRALERKNARNMAVLSLVILLGAFLGYQLSPKDPAFGKLPSVEVEPQELEYFQETEAPMDFEEWFPREYQEPPEWLLTAEAYFYRFMQILIAAALLLGVGVGVYKVISGYRRSFQAVAGEEESQEEDLVESLKQEWEPRFWLWRKQSEEEKIRRYYRKWIRRAAPKTPRSTDTPAEVENFAGVRDEEIHRLYEKARYSGKTCTREESGEVKRRIT